MDQLSETRVFLWWTANYCKGPDRVFPGEYFMDPHYRKWVSEAIISQVVTKRSFFFIFSGIDFTGDHKIRISTNTKTIIISIPESSSA